MMQKCTVTDRQLARRLTRPQLTFPEPAAARRDSPPRLDPVLAEAVSDASWSAARRIWVK
jgi:hypothetical protein